MTKTARIKLARSIRRSLSQYLYKQEPHIRANHPDPDGSALAWLLQARSELDSLIAAERRLQRQPAESGKSLPPKL